MLNRKFIETLLSILPFFVLIFLLSINVFYFGDNAGSGPNQIALLITSATVVLYTITINKTKWEKIEKQIVSSIVNAIPAVIILLLIGSLTASWLISGIIPTMIFYGSKILNPNFFLVTSCIISAFISISIGSSWSTVATIGIAIMGIGKTIGIDEGIVAGAIISGAYFGDKLSPLSDTTNLAPAMAGIDIITHIKYMLYTTIPSIVITLIIFSIINLNISNQTNISDIELLNSIIVEEFNITPVLFVVPAIMITLIVLKIPVVITLFLGTLSAVVFGVFFQQELLERFSNISYYDFIIKSLSVGFDYELKKPTNSNVGIIIKDLFSTGGMKGMLSTIWLIICAMILGGVLEISGILTKVSNIILKFIKGVKSLVISNVVTCIFTNLTTSDQYISLILPAKIFKKLYKKFNLKPENLSRTLEDAGTVTSVLIPWNTCGAVQAGVLGVSTMVYAPFSFFNIISPIMTIIIISIGIKIKKIETCDKTK